MRPMTIAAVVLASVSCGRSPLELGALDGGGGAPGAGGGPAASSTSGEGGAPIASVAATAEGSGGAGAGDPAGAGGAAGAAGSGPGPDPLACIQCVAESCPEALACVQDPVCGQGLFCAFTQCLGGGSPDLMCVADCFNGDLGAALDALQAIGCVLGTCGAECGGLIPGLPGG